MGGCGLASFSATEMAPNPSPAPAVRTPHGYRNNGGSTYNLAAEVAGSCSSIGGIGVNPFLASLAPHKRPPIASATNVAPTQDSGNVLKRLVSGEGRGAGGKGVRGRGKPGTWHCADCYYDNFDTRATCNRCLQNRSDCEGPDLGVKRLLPDPFKALELIGKGGGMLQQAKSVSTSGKNPETLDGP